VWFDESVKRLNNEERGTFLGAFKADDKVFTLMQSGEYRLTGYDLTTHFDEDLIHIEKFEPEKVMSVVYLEGKQGFWYFKRFPLEETDKKVLLISDHTGSKMITWSLDQRPVFKVKFDEKANGKDYEDEEIVAEDFIGVKSYKAKGKRISTHTIKKVSWLEPLEPIVPEVEEIDDTGDDFNDNGQDDLENQEAESVDESKVAMDTKVKAPDEIPLEIVGEDIFDEETEPGVKPGEDKDTKPVKKKIRKKPTDDESSQMTLF